MKKLTPFFLAMLLIGCVQKPVGTVLARFDGTVVTQEDFTQKIQALRYAYAHLRPGTRVEGSPPTTTPKNKNAGALCERTGVSKPILGF